MQARDWDLDKDYPYLVNWWKQHEFGTVPKKCLPPDGIIVEENTANIKSIHKGLNICITEIFKLAKKYNMELVYSMTANTSLHKRYTKYHDMKLVENNVKTFLMDLTKSYTDLEWISDDQQLKDK